MMVDAWCERRPMDAARDVWRVAWGKIVGQGMMILDQVCVFDVCGTVPVSR